LKLNFHFKLNKKSSHKKVKDLSNKNKNNKTQDRVAAAANKKQQDKKYLH
jgi:hypothetical protein